MLDDIEQHVREYTERYRRADIAPSRRPAESKGDRCQQNARENGMGIRKKVEVYGARRNARVLDPEIGEKYPEQLDELDCDQKRPQPDSRELPFQSQGC